MLELVSTRHNPMVDPGLHVWGWQIPVYLFLGGWVAGIMVLSGYLLFKGRHARRSCICFAMPLVALVLLSLGMLALFLDLEHKLYTWRLYVAFEPWSPMSWGAWILLLVYPVLIAMALVRPPAIALLIIPGLEVVSRRLAGSRPLLRALGGASMAGGVALGIYTGILLSALGARPLWTSSILGPLFLASGLSSGAAFAHMVARDREESEALARADNGFLWGELALIALFLIGLSSGGEAQAGAAGLLMGGPYTAAFWVVVVGLGIVAPLLIQSLALGHRIGHTPIAPALVLLGGLGLRFVIVYAGQYSHWPRV
jgi:formate-dependent nitrite reductase membrane component NrfD